jgi:hypothetical protein
MHAYYAKHMPAKPNQEAIEDYQAIRDYDEDED